MLPSLPPWWGGRIWRLVALGYVLKEIIGDGNCLFRSVSYHVSGNEDGYAPIRACAIKEPEKWVGRSWEGKENGRLSEFRSRCRAGAALHLDRTLNSPPLNLPTHNLPTQSPGSLKAYARMEAQPSPLPETR